MLQCMDLVHHIDIGLRGNVSKLATDFSISTNSTFPTILSRFELARLKDWPTRPRSPSENRDRMDNEPACYAFLPVGGGPRRVGSCHLGNNQLCKLRAMSRPAPDEWKARHLWCQQTISLPLRATLLFFVSDSVVGAALPVLSFKDLSCLFFSFTRRREKNLYDSDFFL